MARLVGILNVTPDSFSDGAEWLDADKAIAHAKRLWADGAAILDIGAESTRPGAMPVSPEEEWRRLEPVLKALEDRARISIDTRHAETARRALDLGVGWINDVSGLKSQAMINAVKDRDCKLVVMHSLSVPADPAVTLPENGDPLPALIEFATERVQTLQAAGITKERLIFDPGIGFGKTAAQSLAILQRIKELTSLGLPLFIGHSRKSFLKSFAGEDMEKRDLATAAFSLLLAREGVEYLRVHALTLNRLTLESIGTYES